MHDLQTGFMTERILKVVGNYIGVFVESCPRNVTGEWRDYMRVRVTLDPDKPLKRRTKIRQSGEKWFWINFKYENVPNFCFICGLLGHSEKFCSKLFDTPEQELTKPYGVWMRAPLRRQTKLIGERWLRYGEDDAGWNPAAAQGSGSSYRAEFSPTFQDRNKIGDNFGKGRGDNEMESGKAGNLNRSKIVDMVGDLITSKKNVTIIEN